MYLNFINFINFENNFTIKVWFNIKKINIIFVTRIIPKLLSSVGWFAKKRSILLSWLKKKARFLNISAKFKIVVIKMSNINNRYYISNSEYHPVVDNVDRLYVFDNTKIWKQ